VGERVIVVLIESKSVFEHLGAVDRLLQRQECGLDRSAAPRTFTIRFQIRYTERTMEGAAMRPQDAIGPDLHRDILQAGDHDCRQTCTL
jgi:hypothetical protein